MMDKTLLFMAFPAHQEVESWLSQFSPIERVNQITPMFIEDLDTRCSCEKPERHAGLAIYLASIYCLVLESPAEAVELVGHEYAIYVLNVVDRNWPLYSAAMEG